MTKGIYLAAPSWLPLLYGPRERAELDGDIDWVAAPQSAQSIQEDLSRLQDVAVIFAGWGTAVMDEMFLAAASNLRAVFHAGGSVRYFTTPAFWERAIVLSTATAINALPVAEYTVAAILFGLRGGWYFERATHRAGAFPASIPVAGTYGSTVGLISLGSVGRLVIDRLRSYDLRVIANDPHVSPADAKNLGIELVSLGDLFARSDAVSLHAPLLEETKGMIRGAHFSAMKRGALFINTARGAVVNEPEMIAVLAQRPDLHAVLDVTFPEPPLAGSPLFSLPNVFLTPHIAATAGAEAQRLGRAMVEEFHRWRDGTPLLHQVTKESAPLRG